MLFERYVDACIFSIAWRSESRAVWNMVSALVKTIAEEENELDIKISLKDGEAQDSSMPLYEIKGGQERWSQGIDLQLQ